MSSSSSNKPVDILPKAVILVVLVGAMLGLHRLMVPTGELDPRALLALGFVILAAYTVGQLAEVIKLPHITGYLLAGLVLGSSAAHLVHEVLPSYPLPPPFDHGVLSEEVIDQLLLLDDLALALIALTAGGELYLDSLRKGLGRIFSVLSAQVVLVLGAVMALVWAISGPIEAISLPALVGIGTSGALGIGAVVGAISLATSPAATIAVINSSGSKGETTDTVLSVVVLKDVFVVLIFSAAMTIAASTVPGALGGGTTFGQSLIHMVNSIAVGALIGGVIHAYLRYVNSEILLFLVALIFLTTFVAGQLHLEAALVFIVAGFVSSNFSDQGGRLIHEVERLSLPVYVVFFTLAGAKLHLDLLWVVAGFAVALAGVRMLAIWLSTRLATSLVPSSPSTQKYAWMGFVSQAGLAITLAGQVKVAFPGEVGDGLFALLLGGVALNEVMGPVLLQWGLNLSGDTAQGETEDVEADGTASDQASLPSPAGEQDSWGEPLASSSDELNEVVSSLESELRAITNEVVSGPLTRAGEVAESYLADLRGDYLKSHRRLVVRLGQDATPSERVADFRAQISELASQWRDHVLTRSARARQGAWDPRQLVEVLDEIANSQPGSILAPVEPSSSRIGEGDGLWKRIRRRWIALVMRIRVPKRDVSPRELTRYHLCGRGPERLVGVAAVEINQELHLAARAAELFGSIAAGWERAAEMLESGTEPSALRSSLQDLRLEIDEDFSIAVSEVAGASLARARRVALVLGGLLAEIKADTLVVGTPDLSHGKRRFSRVYTERNQGLLALSEGLDDARSTVGARHAAVAMELELVGLQGRAFGAVEQHAAQLEREMRGRGTTQLGLVDEALGDWLDHVSVALQDSSTAAELSHHLRESAETLSYRIRECASSVRTLQRELGADHAVTALLRGLFGATHSLTDWYVVPSGQIQGGEWALPAPVSTLDIPFRDMAVAFIESRVSTSLTLNVQELHAQALQMCEALEELGRVVSFNTEMAGAELDGTADTSRPISDELRELVSDMALGAIGRSRVRLSRLHESARLWPAEAKRNIRTAVVGSLEELRGQILDGQMLELRRMLLREQVAGSQLVRQAEKWTSGLPEGRIQVLATAHRVLGDDRLESIRQALGLPDMGHAEPPLRVALAEPQVCAGLPLVYRRLFSDRALEAGDLIIGREEELARVTSVVRGNHGLLRTVAVVGMRGSGTSAIASAAARQWGGSVRRLDLEQPVTVSEVESWFAERRPDVLTVLSGVRWLFTLRPDGTRAARCFVERLVEHGGRLPWVITGDEGVWDMAARLCGLSDSVGDVVRLKPLSVDNLTEAILTRNQMSGFDITFDAVEDFGWQMQHLLLRGEDRELRQQEAWFRTLHEACGGVMHDALTLWMASIRSVDETSGRIVVGPVPRPPVARLLALSEEWQLTLLQMVRQGWMDPELHADMFDLERTRSSAQLGQMANSGLIRLREDGRYEVSRHLRLAAQRALKGRRWVS